MKLTVNDREVVLDVDPTIPLMFALRNDLDLKGVRTGCAIGECGVCTVLVDGEPVRSCSTPLETAAGAHITTPEGLGTPDAPGPVQRAFLEEQAGQCGYCINGMIMTTAALAEAHGTSAREAIDEALVEHLCRCGTHVRVLRAVRRALTASAEAAGTAGGGPGDPADADTAARGATACAGACERPEALPPSLEAMPNVEAWVRLLPDGRIEALTGKVEIGQGIRTAMAQLVAAQLGLPAERIVVRPTATDLSPDEGVTSGSRSIEQGGTALAMAAAAFRRLLLARGSKRLGEPVEDLRLDHDGVVRSETGGELSLAALGSDGPLTGTIERSDQPHWHGVSLGESLAREDLRRKLTGAAAYVHDIALPGMLHARALLPPSYDARLESLDEEEGRALPGVRAIIRDGRLVLAIAEREEQAIRAIARLQQSARWEDPGLEIGRDVDATLRSLPAQRYTARSDADVGALLESGTRRLAATYARPYQAHASMAPSCAVAVDDDDGMTIWTHSQGVYPLRRELAAFLDLDESRLNVRHGDGPGCYGQNAADDAAALAAVAARAIPGSPVRFQFSVEDEFAWEPYGSAMLGDLEASLDASGCLVAWRHRTRTDVHSTRPRGHGDALFPSWLRAEARSRPWPGAGEGGARNVVPLYDLPAVEADADFVRTPLRTSALRSLGAYFNIFAVESFMDELAEAAERDPVAFRLDHLRDERAREVLETAAEVAGWAPHVGPSGRGQGVALARYKGDKAYVAQVIDAEIDPDTGQIRVERVVVACDAGVVVNPDGLRNQLEGGAVQGLSRALHEELRVDNRGVHSLNWPTYPVIRFGRVPTIEVVLLDRPGYPPLGAGEAATPPVPAALANAIDDGIGIRLRTLPFTPDRARQRLMEMSEEEMTRVQL